MDPFLAEIRLFAFGRIPYGWLPCEGQLLQIQKYTALYTLITNQFGGDGKTTFALPDLRGRVALGTNTKTGAYPPGEKGGEAEHTLTIAEFPAHTHVVAASNSAVSELLPSGKTWGNFNNGYSTTSNALLATQAITATGGGQAHSNMQPSLALNFCIAVTGIYPPRP